MDEAGTGPAIDDSSQRTDILLGPYDEFIGIEPNGETYKDALKFDAFDQVPEVEFMDPLPSVDQMIQNRLFLTGYNANSWKEEHTFFVLTEFVPANGVDVIFFSILPDGQLYVGSGFPASIFRDINYFIRTHEGMNVEITSENFSVTVQNGSVLGQGIESLLRVMSNVYAPTFFADETWPDSIKNDFALQLHRFMSALTDTRWKLNAKTVLYIPMETFKLSPVEEAKDKDLVGRLEMIVIHWTRQIKEVLSSQSALDDDEGTGPLDEIEYWRNRCEDLTGISRQLDNKSIIEIAQILSAARSSYVTAFIRLSEEIKNTSAEAQDNLKFLATMKDVCVFLSDLTPAQIPPILPKIINQIRMIWTNSRFYKSKAIITGLFRKISNEIVVRCCSVISLDEIFAGRVRSASLRLRDCISCCENYKTTYENLKRMHLEFSGIPWDTEDGSIFAHVDAFIQRCRDLLEICECQADFGRFEEGNKAEMPIFQGARGPEIELLLLQIENMFVKLMTNLSEKRSVILDVKATTWHDQYNRFCSGVKGLEIMMQNVINMAFETVTTIQQGVEILDVFAHLQKREAIRRTLETNTHVVVDMFLDCLSKVKQEMTMRPFMGLPRPQEPKFALNGIFWRFLRRRLDRSMSQLDLAFFVPTIAAVLEEQRSVYDQMCLSIEEMTRKVFNEFMSTIEYDPLKCLEVPILMRSAMKPDQLESTFPGSVLRLINELDHFVLMGIEVPHYAAEAHRRKSELRHLREIVLVMVREYNRILSILNPEEKALFHERIKMLDKKIAPGFAKIQWPVKSMVEFFVNDSRLQICSLQGKVDGYKMANADIRDDCELIAKTLLLKLEPGRIYENDDFNQEQSKHRERTAAKLVALHQDIIRKMSQVKDTFVSENPDVQARWYSHGFKESLDNEFETFHLDLQVAWEFLLLITAVQRLEWRSLCWHRYTERMDRYCQEAFRLNVKFSLGDLRRAINGDGRNEPNPFFKILLNLDGSSLVFAPTIPQLTNVVISLCDQLVEAFANIPRLPEVLTKNKTTGIPSIAATVEADEEVVKVQESIKRGIVEIAKPVQDPLGHWDKFREIWEQSKDEVINHYREIKRSAASINSDIGRFTEVTNKVLDAEALVTVRFLQLDFSQLKNAIAAHCREWQMRLINLLMDMTVEDLNGIYKYMSDMAKRLSHVPENLLELVESIELLEKVFNERTEIEGKFSPLEEQFAILDKCEVTYQNEVATKRVNLVSDWANFKETLVICEEASCSTKERFKLNLLAESERLKKRISALLSELQTSGHHNLGPPPEEALAACQGFRDRLAVMTEKENEIRSGLLIFKIDQQPCKESTLIQKELDLLEQIWTWNKEWEEKWMTWKYGKFSDLQTDDMETLATAMFRKFTRLARDNRSRRWEVLDASRDRVDQFRRTIPLISDLRNSAMRPRHWDAIRKEMARDFDQNDDTFTLEKIISLGFDRYAVFISELSQAATKELSIEKALNKIGGVWLTIELDITPYKDKGHLRLRSTDDLFTILEDHQVQLSAMKSSRFVKPFEHEVDSWERALSKITETVELLLTVQRQWLYMETIFMGDDIRKQLPKESTLFDDLDVEWKRIMTAMNEVKNARRCSDLEGICEALVKMNEKFEVIEKSLDMYLETKRQTFPRFYFISNDDLLEILGQGKNPEAVIPHLKKCFDNINTVKLERKTIKKTQLPATKGHSPLKPQILRKQPTDMHRSYEGTEEASQDANMIPNKETLTVLEEHKSPPNTGEHEEAPEAAVESAANRLNQSGKPSFGEVPSELNQSSIHLLSNSNAMHVTRRSEMRELYFGSSGSDNNISRSGSAITITYTQFDGVAMISADGEEVPWKKTVHMEGPVEMWLLEIESQMRKTLRDLLRDCRLVMKKASVKREKVVKEWPGQICIATSQIQWTADVTKALIMVNRRHDKKPLRMIRKKQKAILKRFSEAIRSNLSKIQRLKINALVVVEVHQRDIIDKLYKSACKDTGAFEWLAQLRFYWEKEEDDCYVKQTNASFHYGYEYLGNSGRLVITPLTDRCYITLTTALSLNRGGSPKGPAGTGKTETTKDLGKNLGDYVIVINCSDGLDYKSMGRMFSGLAQSGAWGCFDEFNRINIEVLSVVAQQILAILSALASLPKGKGVPSSIRFMFEGRMVKLVWSCGIFITMNPGYAGRTELPDNLKSMFRPIAMVVPDFTMIAEITLFAEGFDACKVLAKKVFTLYSLCNQQLSKQDHYDFGLRALISVLRYAGRRKRANPGMQDEEILLLSMNDMNLAKLTSVDLPLFRGIVSDLFPGVEAPAIDYTDMKNAIKEAFKELRLQATKFTVSKVIELYETQSSRHSVMIVGKTLSGKSATWKVLQLTHRKMMEAGHEGFFRVWDYPLNPKAVSLGELYGEFNISTNEWSDGILSSLMRQACADEKPDYKWILFDGPVDALWIESMNSVMDDNKILTLINGERISMPDQVSLLFEVEDLAVASPATVSRAGMVYNDVMDLGWWPYVNSWLAVKEPKILVTTLTSLFEKDLPRILDFTMNNCNKLIPYDMSDPELYARLIEMLFQFCTIWSVCCVVDEDGRKKIDSYIREMDGSFPSKDSIFEFFLDAKSRAWIHWEEKLRGGWKYDPEQPFYKILVPTVDTIRYNYLVNTLVSGRSPVLITGPVGTGKTSIAQDVLFNLDKESWTYLTINMSAQTSSNNVQDIIESRVEKRTKGTYVPTRGTKMITFMDDLNMPVKDEFGSQPPLELIRQWIDYGFWYDREKQLPKRVQKMFLLGCMGPPGGGRMSISRRLQSRFNQINVTFPTDANLKQIFGTMINQKIADFEDEVRSMGDTLTDATVSFYNSIVAKFLPTPTRIHYLFNLRDISKICQGILRANKITIDSKTAMLRLWIHESFRVFADRLINSQDVGQFIEILGEKLAQYFDQTFHNLCPSRSSPVFVDVLNKDMIYEDIQDLYRLRSGLSEFLNEYNDSPGVVPMDLVLFKDAIEHTCRILRVISQPRGNMLLVGVGGSGRNSVTKLAGHICRYKIFNIEVNKNYRKADFREDLKRLYRQTGVQCQSTLFLFSDTHVAEEAFLEDVNNMLSSGEVPNLFKSDEFEEVSNAIVDQAKKEGVDESSQSIYRYFIERVRASLHIVLCMSPIGDPFRDRIRMYPGFVNCTTIDWFSEWPNDALLEVATKYLSDLDLFYGNEDAKMKSGVARVFALMHNTVTQMSEKMMDELRRRNYVTPTNYLELVSGYKKMLESKRRELSDWANKLRSGLGKIDDTRTKVEEMSVELSEAKEKVAVFQKECDDYLVILVEQRREADEQTKSVTLTKEKIKVDETKCLQMAEVAQADLAQAMPALEAAITALEALNKKDITEIKSYGQPPHLVRKVMEAVMILRQAPPTWTEAKKQLGEQDFINQLVNFDKDHISDKTLKKISTYCAQDDFMPEVVGKVSFAAKSLCMWVRAMEEYGRIYRYVEPKRQRLLQAEAILAEKRAQLAAAQAKLDALMAEMARLQQEYNDKMEQKDELRRKAEALEKMLERARMLVDGLADEKVRWTQTVADLERRVGLLPGDCLLSAGYISYMGPFLSKYREELVSTWVGAVEKEKVPKSTPYSFTEFLSDPAKVREWNIQGLPRDSFSVDNGVIVSRASRWPLMIDPQCQAMNWIKSMEGSQLQVIDLQMKNYMQILEHAIVTGSPVLLQNILETLDSGLDPVLNKSIMKVGGAEVIRLGDREVEYNANFRFYLTTKLSNPRYAPEICTKTTVVNFAVMQEGLEAQLLGIVVRKEKPELEEQKDSLVIGIANGKKKLKELEDELLRLLNETQGSLLEDEGLFLTLQTSKATSAEVTEFLSISERTEVQIDAARDGYRPCARRAAILFFVLNDLGSIDPMYQFALDAYIDLFVLSIEKSQRSPRLSERIENLNKHHTYAVYRYTCRGLFERHKLLFSFQICVKILEEMGKLNLEEYMFLLRGGIVLDRAHQMDNPVPSWLSSLSWDNVTELNKLANYRGIVTSFEQYPRDWHIWYTSDEPENSKLPAEWESSTNEFQRMLIVRSLRPDRVTFCATAFITNNIGKQFVEPPVLDMRSVVEDSSARSPLIFVLSPGVDPTGGLLQIAEACGMGKRFNALSLGQGQAPIATRLIEEGVRNGNWVFLANCHLSLSWMPQLDKLVEQMGGEQTHGEFRLWLSSSPTPHFPISILQAGIKMTTEPPKGLRSNMKRLYQIVKEDQFSTCTKPEKYKKLLFCLCFFHSVLIERRKFRMLGWNVTYEFNDADFEVSENILSTYLDQYQETPWEALRYLIAGINYGGHVTDDWDRRLLLTYVNGYFTENAISEAFFKLSPLAQYYIPRDGSLSAYREFVSMLPNIDHPEAFGQHLNADIASQIQEAKLLFDALLSLQPKISSAGEESKESKVLKLIKKMKEQVPDNLDYHGTAKIFSNDRSPLKIVLLQEIQRYNDLLDLIRSQLIDLERGIQGLVVMSSELEDIFAAIFENRVPFQWQYAYNSLRPLSSWVRDLAERIKVFWQWSQTARAPKAFWIGAFTFPTGFLTAVMQTAARTHGVGVDTLSWDFNVLTISEQNIPSSPKEGVYVSGLFLEGAGWDMKNQCLMEAAPMMLNRAGPPGKPSFMIGIELKTGDFPSEHWIKRGTALLMSLDN
ncbi:unnamed protein product [Hydatigera taeniaeformis]|uniref:Dynein-1, subspecies f n=1 Tax=Hydatigena taeniaeformis TaxID=6205 RepID=A0A0R3X108_HYDTA|nr:unnamed protein product [Hydatigera taeniaeformis]